MPTAPLNPIPVLHVEETVKRYYYVKTKNGDSHRKKYYDVDWRFYIMHKYGRYMVCGTRCPMREYYNEAWPVVSTSFSTKCGVLDYISLLIGSNKVNMTLFASSILSDNDIAFTQPTNERFRELDAERGDRKGELVGYDRFSLMPVSRESKLEKTLTLLSALNSGGVMPFTVSPHPSKRVSNSNQSRQEQQQPQQPQPQPQPQPQHVEAAASTASIPDLYDEVEKYTDYGYIFGVNDYDHDAYAEVD